MKDIAVKDRPEPKRETEKKPEHPLAKFLFVIAWLCFSIATAWLVLGIVTSAGDGPWQWVVTGCSFGGGACMMARDYVNRW